MVKPIERMSDISAIRVLNFTGKKEEWLAWSDKAKAKISGGGGEVNTGRCCTPPASRDFWMRMGCVEMNLTGVCGGCRD